MNKYFCYFIILFCSISSIAQNDLKNAVFFKPGYNVGYDNYSSKDRLIFKDYNFEFSYQREIFDILTVEVMYSFVSHSFIPKGFSRSDFRNDMVLDEFFRSSDDFFTEHEIQDNHFLGINLHYSFINNAKWYASFFAGLGYTWWSFNGSFVNSYAFMPGSEENIVEWRRVQRNDGHFFKQVGFQINYTFNERYVVGIQPSWIFINDRYESVFPTINNPNITPFIYDPIDNYLRLNLNLGYRF